ncbi:aldehyde dehydrogenase [Punctularia strigosozonata HHB-11173 SS5]|uniref:aldehyde dehydrogenase n=1 Tax=Punctularia strigosozonata (strain HHB-11173) TaxID=741275 RepID=UPI0004416D9C|nr:aldehyde dehydrogenase [Punctularia strigosozonata HHB-11173 SS5]EIN08994.1 aldehyde dehydrogenase [Punctularia strigosozonata HHB-11173 SS5]
MAPFTNLFIDGEWRPSSDQGTFEVRNPYSNAVVGTAASATLDDCKDAVEAAGRAFKSWEHTSFAERRNILLKAADIFATEKVRKKIVHTMTEETAAVQEFAGINAFVPTEQLQHVAGLVNDLKGESFPSRVAGGHVIAQRRAMGVVYSIAPWNAPIILTVRAVAFPIICGNTVVLKSSEYSPRTQAIVVEVFEEAGLPRGVLNFVSSSREQAAAVTSNIIGHPLVRKITFTGSDVVGRKIATEAAKYLKPCVFELGGKSPAVVLKDANLEEAARAIIFGSMFNSGQICMSTERVIVQKPVAKPLLEAITNVAAKLKAGDPSSDASAKLSALFDAGSAQNIVNMISEAKAEGATVLLGDAKNVGAVVQPHVVTGVKPGMRLWDRESFGPVLVFAEAETVDELVDLANASDYTLVASVWTKDINTALDVAGRIRAGCTSVNGPTFHTEELRGDTGLGGATGYGQFDVANFTDVRMIVVHPAHREYPLVG